LVLWRDSPTPKLLTVGGDRKCLSWAGPLGAPFPVLGTAKNRTSAWRPCSDETLHKQPIRVGARSYCSNGPMAKGECKRKVKKRKREKEKRRNLERESGKVLLVAFVLAFVLAFVDGWMGGCVAVHGAGRHDPQCRPSGVFHTVCRSPQDHQ
jgi:hypothetical protein